MKKIDLEILDEYINPNTNFCREKHKDTDLFIYGYDNRKSNGRIIWNKFNQIMRGLIVDKNGVVKARSFNKFFTYKEFLSKNEILCSEGQIIKLPDESYRIFEKLDGTLGMLYWVDDEAFVATQRSFVNQNAIKGTQILQSKYKDTIAKLDKNYSYIFEILFPETNVLINYGKREELVLIGIIDNSSGEEIPLDRDIGFPLAIDFTSKYKDLSFEELKALNIENLTGF